MAIKLKQESIDQIKAEIIEELGARQAKFDQSDIDDIVTRVKSRIEIPKLDSQEIIKDLLSDIKSTDEEKRADFYRNEIFSPDIKSALVKQTSREVLDQIEIPKDGKDAEPFVLTEENKDEIAQRVEPIPLTDRDKKEIAELIDVTALIKDRKQDLIELVKQLKSGKIKLPSHAGIDVKEIIAEINKILGTDDWRFGLPGDGTLPLNTNYINFTKDATGIPDQEGVVDWNDDDLTLNVNTGMGTKIQVGQEIVVYVRNRSGVDIANGDVTYVTGSYQGRPTVAKANADSHVTLFGAIGVATTDILDDGFGFVSDFGAVRDIDTSGLATQVPLYVAAGAGNDGKLTDVRPSFPDYSIQIGQNVFQDANFGAIALKVDQNANDTVVNFWNGTFRESINFTVSSNGTTITGSLSPDNGHENMTMIFSDGFSILDTTPAKTITLTPGTDAAPVTNFVYIPRSTKVLTVSTSDWPVGTEHIKVANVFLKSAATTQTDGALGNRNWNDHIQSTQDNQGHLAHIGEKIRQGPAEWDSGALASVSGLPSNVYIAATVGVVYQLHRQTYPAQSMPTDQIEVVNNFAAAYTTTTNLNTQTLDALGVALANRSFSFVIWGVQNRTGQPSRLMCNLPVGSYAKNAPATAVSDPSNLSVYTIPTAFKGTGFLIARFTFVLEADGITWSLFDTEDLRGTIAGTGAGGGTSGAGTEFPDSTFRIQNSLDDTKEIDFDASGITTATTRTITMPDNDVDLGASFSGTLASPPTGMSPGDFWRDTTDSATHPIIRISTVST